MEKQNRRLRIKQTLMAVGALLTIGLFQNCSDAKFSAGSADNTGLDDDYWRNHLNQPNTNPNSCYTILHQISTPVKLLFVVDNSGSNVGANGSDPNKTVRRGSIQAFFDDYKAKQNFYWGFITFRDTVATAYINSGSTSNPIFTNQLSPMQTAIDLFNASLDSSNTPYQAAFDMTRAAIQNDTAYDANTKWIVVFMSDGLPNPTLDDASLNSGVQSIVNLRPGKITFNTIYYGQADPAASGRLGMMAATGGGEFLDTNANPTGKDFLISNVINVPGTVCQ